MKNQARAEQKNKLQKFNDLKVTVTLEAAELNKIEGGNKTENEILNNNVLTTMTGM